jgi:rubrerythrin
LCFGSKDLLASKIQNWLETMKEVIDWLRHVEQLACDVYQAASDHFSKDKELSAFLSGLAEDESLHFHLMGRDAGSWGMGASV